MRFEQKDWNTLCQIMAWRRDVRGFRGEPVAEELLATLEAAIDYAPSVGNSRPWRILRITSPERRATVADHFEKTNRRAGEIYDERTRNDYIALKLAGLREAPVHLAFFTEQEPAEGRGLGRQTMPETLRYSTVMAIHTLWLAARVHNIGLGWVSILEPDVLSRLLEVPENWDFTAYLCLGHPANFDDQPELHRADWQRNVESQWFER